MDCLLADDNPVLRADAGHVFADDVDARARLRHLVRSSPVENVAVSRRAVIGYTHGLLSART